MADEILSRTQLLAAEIFSYSFANYANHTGIGHERFENIMPDRAKTLERAVEEAWDIAKVADHFDIDPDSAASLIARTKDALKVIDAQNPAFGFRESIRQMVAKASEEGLDSEESARQLVTQICYRVSDLRFLMLAADCDLKSLCREFRQEAD